MSRDLADISSRVVNRLRCEKSENYEAKFCEILHKIYKNCHVSSGLKTDEKHVVQNLNGMFMVCHRTLKVLLFTFALTNRLSYDIFSHSLTPSHSLTDSLTISVP